MNIALALCLTLSAPFEDDVSTSEVFLSTMTGSALGAAVPTVVTLWGVWQLERPGRSQGQLDVARNAVCFGATWGGLCTAVGGTLGALAAKRRAGIEDANAAGGIAISLLTVFTSGDVYAAVVSGREARPAMLATHTIIQVSAATFAMVAAPIAFENAQRERRAIRRAKLEQLKKRTDTSPPPPMLF